MNNSPRRRRDPDQRPHGRRHDLARAPTGTLPSAPGSCRTSFSCVSTKTQPRAGFFVLRSRNRLHGCRHEQASDDRYGISSTPRTGAAPSSTRCSRRPPRSSASKLGHELAGKSIALVFFNPSLRTRTSFELGAFQLGGHAVVLAAGQGRVADRVRRRHGDGRRGRGARRRGRARAVALRRPDRRARVPEVPGLGGRPRGPRAAARSRSYATVPVINMETITHPCQELAHIHGAAGALRHADLRGKKYVLTWTYHPKPLNTAVANSALMIATRFGMDVTLLCPTPEYVLDERYMDFGAQQRRRERRLAARSATTSTSAYRGADVVYAKSWGALPYFGRWDDEKPIRDAAQALHRRRGQDGADQRRRLQPLPAAAPQRQGDRRGDGLARAASPSTRPRTACTCRRR